MSTNGHLAPQNTHAQIEESYYALTSGSTLSGVTLVTPVVLQGVASEGALAFPARIVVPGTTHADPEYVGAVAIRPGGNPAAPSGSAGIVVRAVAPAIPGPGTGGTVLEVGTDTEAPNIIAVAGVDGLSLVYNQLYAPVIQGTEIAGITGSIPENTGVGLFSFTPTVTGAYMLQFNINIANTDSVPLDGIIEYFLNEGTESEVQFTSNTLKSISISKASDFDEINGVPGTLSPPIDFSSSDLCFLDAGELYRFGLFSARNSTAGGVAWSVANYQVRVIQMC